MVFGETELLPEFALAGALLVSVSAIVSSQCRDMFDVVPRPHDKLTRKHRWAYPSEHAQVVRGLAGKSLAVIFATYLAMVLVFGIWKVFGNGDQKVSLEGVIQMILVIKLLLLVLPLYIAWRTTVVRSRIWERL